MMPPATWLVYGVVMSAARLALMGWVLYQLAWVPYSDGNRTVFYLLPDANAVNHSSLSDMFNVYGVYLVNLVCLA